MLVNVHVRAYVRVCVSVCLYVGVLCVWVSTCFVNARENTKLICSHINPHHSLASSLTRAHTLFLSFKHPQVLCPLIDMYVYLSYASTHALCHTHKHTRATVQTKWTDHSNSTLLLPPLSRCSSRHGLLPLHLCCCRRCLLVCVCVCM